MNPIDQSIDRAACWLIMVLCLIATLVLLDSWRFQRRTGVMLPNVAMVLLAVTLGTIGVVCAKAGWTGNFPHHCEETCP